MCQAMATGLYTRWEFDSDLPKINTYLIPHLITDRSNQPTVIKKSNQFISFGFSDIQLLDSLNFHGGATSLYLF